MQNNMTSIAICKSSYILFKENNEVNGDYELVYIVDQLILQDSLANTL